MNNFMRRKERQITDNNKIIEIIDKCDCCRLGFKDEESVYIVPLNFGYKKEDEKIILYFHGANEGKKVNLIKSQSNIGFEMDTKHELIKDEVACGYSYLYQSIIGNGNISIVEDMTEKISALQCIMKHYSKKDNWNFNEKALERVATFKLVVTNLSCKEH